MTATVHQIHNGIVNIYLIIEPQGLTLIDTGVVSGPEAVERSLQQLGRSLRDIRHILITHSDPDHVGGAADLKAATGARLYASSIEAEAMARGESSRPMQGNRVTLALFGLFAAANPITPVEADELLEEGTVLPILGGLQVLSTPGHTPDHLSFYAPQYRTLFAGDSMMSLPGGLRFAKGPATWNYDIGIASVRKQAELGAATVFCGHGSAVLDPASKFPRAAIEQT